MTKDARTTVISWLTVLLVLGVCIYVIIHMVQTHRLEAEAETEKTIGDLGTIKVNINGTSYDATIVSNNTAKDFLNILPMTLSMNDSDGNRKYSFMYSGLSVSSTKTSKMEAGDIAIAGSSTVVVFYKSTKSSGKFIKIGHIDNLPNLGSGNISVSFSK